MTKQYGFVVDVSRCTGCRTCAVACKDAHNLPVGLNLRRVLEEASGSWRQDRMTGAWHQDVRAWYVSIACNHCENPACVKVCPTKAHYKRAEDGLVVIDRDKCIGCGMCAQACPYGAPQLDEKDEVRRLPRSSRKGRRAHLRRSLSAARDKLRRDLRTQKDVRYARRDASPARSRTDPSRTRDRSVAQGEMIPMRRG